MNTFQSRLDKIEDNNIGNNFQNQIRKIIRRGYSIIDDTPFHYKSFNVNGNWHSTRDEGNKFTNYINSYEDENRYYNILLNLFKKIYNNNYNVLEDFQIEENNYSQISSETKRLKDIIKNANNIENVPEINELIPIKKLKDTEKRYKGIRLFVNIRENGEIDLYLIDLYHLGINAYDTNTGRYNLDRNYNSNKKCNKCISKIVDDCIEEANNS